MRPCSGSQWGGLGDTCSFSPRSQTIRVVCEDRGRCGDGMINQPSEHCDGSSLPASAPRGSGCSSSCTLTPPDRSGACGVCERANCSAQLADVEANRAATEPVLECLLGPDWRDGNRAPVTSCANLDLLTCFCGTRLAQECVNSAPSALNGQCAAQILAATGCTTTACVPQIFLNPDNASGKATQLVQCRQDFCFEDCFTF